jgi:uncharacterized protein (TIGR03437 family)
MIRRHLSFLAGVFLCAASHAATINTTLTATATGTIGTTITATGTASLSGITGANNLPFSATVSLTPDSSGNLSAPFTITFSNGDKLNGTLSIPPSVLTGSGTAKATITGGTGAYAGATGSFPSLTGSGALTATGFSINFSGAGTITTGGSGGGPTGPSITQVGDAAAYTNNVAPGSIFFIKGSGLAPSGLTQFSPPRPTVSPTSNIKVTFTPAAGGTGTDAYLWYLYDQSGTSQIAGILPSTVAPGAYNVTVTNGTVSAPFSTQVVANKLTLFTQDSSGSGLTSLQGFISASRVDLDRLTSGTLSDGTTISPAHPGQAVIAYGTGLGAFAAADNDPAKALHDYRGDLTIQAIVGGMAINVDYAGLAGYPGEDQINFTLPDNVPTGCAVTLQFSVNGNMTPPTSISIAPDKTSNACVIQGYTTAQLQKLDQGGTITSGGFSITQFTITDPTLGTVKSDAIGGGFFQLTAFQLSSAAVTQASVSFLQQGTCTVSQSTTTGAVTSGVKLTYLDAGGVTVTGPASSSLSNTALTKTNNVYSLATVEGFTVPGLANFTLPGGGYTINGAGGNDIGAFSATINIGSPLTITGGLPGTVVRNTGLTLNWTGGTNATDPVEIYGGTTTRTGAGASAVITTTTFVCLTMAGQKTFTVPASILNQLPATTGTGDTGSLGVATGAIQPFSAPLKAGGSIDSGSIISFAGTGAAPKYQ